MKISKLGNVDDRLFYKTSKIRISSSRSFKTPIKASNYKFSSGVNEIYKKFSKDTLNKMMINEKFETQKNATIKQEKNDNANFLFVEYDGEQNINYDQLETLCDIQHAHSDVIIPPTFSKLVKSKKGEKQKDLFIKLINKSLEIFETLNNKPIIGMIPAIIPRQFLKNIIKNYYEHGITCFAIDYCGKSVDSNLSWANMLTRQMVDYAITEESFIYGFNVYDAHFKKKEEEVLAKDFISFGYGVDILGLKHMPIRLRKEQWNEIKSRKKTIRTFSPENYSYRRVLETEISKSGINHEKMKDINLNLQISESNVLRDKIISEDSLMPYIETKKKVSDGNLRDMEKLRDIALKNKDIKPLDHYF
ncbi:hypothetical protein MARBORIA2_06500 [Methanobrevibacter arboriphilus]|uniref:hypothetical protein n=1 Tax=Methanobrevibacter arboriphilus TaxID=39441 RepID=UPI0022EDB960|nr:hypothetical protein [Methanobrevibacter arboriphilus]GLI11560.1 hypothetical protein MARBORIA2_06500 [Methanobrevibacter arboriphilus]